MSENVDRIFKKECGMDVKYTVWNLAGVPNMPIEKQIEILNKLQNRVHELFDALVLAEEFLAANCNQVHEMKPIYDALGKKMENPI